MAPKRFFALLAALALCLVPAACGDDDPASDGSSESSGATKVTITTTEPSKGKVEVEAPKTIPAGVVELTFENAGKGPHDAQLIRVEGDHSAKETMEKTIASGEGKPIPDWITDGGGVGSTKPGETVTVTQVLEPGTYYLFDTENSGGGGEGEPNAVNGGMAKIEVTGESGGGELPATDATITAQDYSFEGEGVKPGVNRVTFANEGEQLHHLIAVPIEPGVEFAEVEKLFRSEEEPKGPPPVDFENGVGTAVIDGGQEQVVDLEFQKGKYALVCFITDRKGGPPHVAMGMISELDVE
jgi:plastocyanin